MEKEENPVCCNFGIRFPNRDYYTFPEREQCKEQNSLLGLEVWAFSGFWGRLGFQNCNLLFFRIFGFLVCFGFVLFLPVGFRVSLLVALGFLFPYISNLKRLQKYLLSYYQSKLRVFSFISSGLQNLYFRFIAGKPRLHASRVTEREQEIRVSFGAKKATTKTNKISERSRFQEIQFQEGLD